MNKHISSWTLAPVTLAMLLSGASVLAGSPHERSDDKDDEREIVHKKPKREVIEIKDARMKIEVNATDGDAGIQVFMDTDEWEVMNIFDPNNKLVFRSINRGSFAEQGGTELFLESAEPDFTQLPLADFLARFPEGKYRFKGRTINGERLVGRAVLTHNIPEGPRLVAPLEGHGPVDPNNTVVMWEPVAPVNGSPIIAYQVLVVQRETPYPAIPKITLDVMMPATATSLTVPPGFLQPDTEYEWEVLAIEEGGNQTLSSSFLHTTP